MAVVNGYTSVVELRDYLGDAGSILDADLLEFAINAASRRIDEFTGRQFWDTASVETRQFRPRDIDQVTIDDIATKTGLVVSTTDSVGGVVTNWVNDVDFVLSPTNADKRCNAYSWWMIEAIGAKSFLTKVRHPSLSITATWGFNQVPDDVHSAALILSTHYLLRKDSPYGVAGMGEFGAIRVARMDPDVRALIQPYVRMTNLDW